MQQKKQEHAISWMYCAINRQTVSNITKKNHSRAKSVVHYRKMRLETFSDPHRMLDRVNKRQYLHKAIRCVVSRKRSQSPFTAQCQSRAQNKVARINTFSFHHALVRPNWWTRSWITRTKLVSVVKSLRRCSIKNDKYFSHRKLILIIST